MKSVLALDRYTNKYLNINKVSPEILENLKVGDKIVYEQPDPKTGAMQGAHLSGAGGRHGTQHPGRERHHLL